MKIIVTGCAGFIGFHLCKRLLIEGEEVIGIDNINSYYDIKLKNARLKELHLLSKVKNYKWHFFEENIEDEDKIRDIFKRFKPSKVVHLAAQAGVRYSLINPKAYIKSNILGFGNLIELSRIFKVKNFIYASSSSVYGGNEKVPFQEKDPVDHPVSLYAASKRSNELIAHTYSHLYDLPCTGLRFFTVYGPWGRPDMAPMIFADAIFAKKPINIFNNGDMFRDFTFIDDVIESVFRLIYKSAQKNINFKNNISDSDPSSSWAPFKILNIGNNKSIKLMEFIRVIENEIGEEAIKIFKPMQPGDVKKTFADTSEVEKITSYKPSTSINIGVKIFIDWYKEFYRI